MHKEFDLDDLASARFEKARRLLEKSQSEGNEDGKTAYLEASVLIAYSGLEAYLNAICEEIAGHPNVDLLTKSILLERKIEWTNGVPILGALQYSRIDERVSFLIAHHTGDTNFRTEEWWSSFKESVQIRNQIAHPKKVLELNEALVTRCLKSALEALNSVFMAVYKSEFPSYRRETTSRMSF